jgi:peptidoglycan/LPS O-acetylase OafA/YrhL
MKESVTQAYAYAPTLAEPAPPAAPPKKQAHLVGLDALRAVAALSVCLFHFTGGMLSKLTVPAAKELFSKGYLGVEIFFVISGFIIPYSLLTKNYRVSGFYTYFKQRVLRINPPAYISILLIIAQWLVIDKFVLHSTKHLDTLTWGRLLHNFLFTVPFTSYTWISIVFWTLAVEFQFYIVIGLLYNSLFERPAAWFFGLYALAGLAAMLPGSEVVGFIHYSAFFALGGIALLWRQRRLPLAGYVAGLAAFSAVAYWQTGPYGMLAGLLTALAINNINFRIPILSFVGKLSYSLYLTHAIFGTSFEFVLVRLFPPSSDAQKLVLTGGCLVLAVGGAYVFYRLVEQPCMRLVSPRRR